MKPLLQTKFYIPKPRPNHVKRSRLISRLNESLADRLTLISAPAGYGKSALLAEWLSNRNGSVAWLTLDAFDEDLHRFLQYLITCLRQVVKDVGVAALAALQARKPPAAETIMTSVINDLMAVEDELMLVLDDYHLLQEITIHEAVAFLVEHLPESLHLVIAGRADPPLPLAKLRAEGQIHEIRASDLAFTEEEARAFLNQAFKIKLSKDDLEQLLARTEGWVAGLQMAGLSLREREDHHGFIRSFAGDDRYVMDYLMDEVLALQPDRIQSFLMQSSILDRFCDSLCDAVVYADQPPGECRSILDKLEQSELFLISLDNKREWYRYHRLFADLLQSRLHQQHPELVKELHSRASLWFGRGAQGDLSFAHRSIQHALEAEDFDLAADVMERSAEAVFMRSEVSVFLHWMARLPESFSKRRPLLSTLHAMAMLLGGFTLESVQAQLANANMADKEGQWIGEIHAINASLAMFKGEVEACIHHSERSLASLPKGRLFFRSAVGEILAISLIMKGDTSAGLAALKEVAAVARRTGNVMIAVGALSNVAGILMAAGALASAERVALQAMELATDDKGFRLPIAGKALLTLGEIAREGNRLSEAEAYLEESVDLIQRFGEVGAVVGYLTLARLRMASGDFDHAFDTLERARTLAEKTEATEMDDFLVDALELRLNIAVGDLRNVKNWIDSHERQDAEFGTKNLAMASFPQLQEIDQICHARGLMALGQQGQALEILLACLPAIEARGEIRRKIEVLNLLALTHWALGHQDSGMAYLERALTAAESAGFIRIFLDEGETMARMLYEAGKLGVGGRYPGKLLAEIPNNVRFGSRQEHKLVEPLSSREMEVLRLVSRGMTNREIATRLHLTLRTVKFHTSNIYGKLEVKNRTEAVAKARVLGLITQ